MRDVKQGESVQTGARRRRGVMRKQQPGIGQNKRAVLAGLKAGEQVLFGGLVTGFGFVAHGITG